MSRNSEVKAPIKLHFADGTTAHFTGGSAFDFVLSPVFLKYCSICTIIFALLHHRPDLDSLAGLELFALWLSIIATTIAWFLFAATVIVPVSRLVRLNAVYTPFITVPCVSVNEIASEFLLSNLLPAGTVLSSFEITYLIQSSIAVLLFDVLFGNYVASHHPSLEVEPKRDGFKPHAGTPPDRSPQAFAHAPPDTARDAAPAAQPPVDPQPEGQKHEACADTGFVKLAGRHIDPASLISMEIEGHYLRIQFTHHSSTERGKLRDAIKDVGSELGIQVNRSTWVAASQIAVLTRKGPNQGSVTLKTGKECTVSRARLSAVSSFCERLGVRKTRE